MTLLRMHLARLVATCFYIGYIPLAPGTFGSLAAMVFVAAVKPSQLLLLILILFLTAAGALSARIVGEETGDPDHRTIVIDEYAGYLVSVFLLPCTTGYLIAAFFLFRFFDILKPPPIGTVDRKMKGGAGVMLDDILAGIAANAVLQIWRHTAG